MNDTITNSASADAIIKNYDLNNSYLFCQQIAKNHYENFPVASFLLPAKIRKNVAAIYAFARYADDLSDIKNDKMGLLEWRMMLHKCLSEKEIHPIFTALGDTIKEYNLPISLFDDLITAFLMDLEKNRYEDFNELLHYCKYSANPVGRIILHLYGYEDEDMFILSDYICTALQLTNFWQDIHKDLMINRIYIPQNYFKNYNYSENSLSEKLTSSQFKNLLNALLISTSDLYNKGNDLIKKTSGRLKLELKFTIAGGIEILRKIKKTDYNVLNIRPVLTKSDWFRIAYTIILNWKRYEKFKI